MEIFLVILSVIGLTLCQPPPPPPPLVKCDGVENLEYLPNPIDCSKFFQCIDNEAFLLSCPRGLYFNAATRRCSSYDDANCVASPPPTPTPRPTVGPPTASCEDVPNFRFVPSPISCYNYYQCIDGNAFLLSCPIGLHFDEERQTCDDPQNANCALTPPTTRQPPTPPGPTVTCDGVDNLDYVPSPIDCSKYYQCIDDEPFLLSCPRGLYFNRETRRCTTYDEANCVLTTPTTRVPPGPPTVSCEGVPNLRFVPSPVSCTNYYQCIDDEAFLLSCPIGQHFDEARQMCDEPDRVNCVIGSTTPAGTTTTSSPEPSVSCEGVPNLRFISSPLSCFNYYQCIDGDAFLLSCPIGQHFDEARQMCDDPDRVNCVLGTTTTTAGPTTTTPLPPPPPTCEGIPNFRFIPSARSCYSYFQCINGTPFELKCPRGLYFNEKIQTCDSPSNVECVSSRIVADGTPDPSSTLCENEEDYALLPHPTSCNLFYQCFNGIDFLVSCPVGRYFDDISLECRESEAVNCGERTRRPTTTTPAPIIDPQCRGVQDGLFVPNPYSCTSYYQCLNGRANPRFCDDGLWFDELLQDCDDPANVNCLVTTTTQRTFPTVPTDDPCVGLNDVYVGSKTHCEVFYFCINGDGLRNTCLSGLHFDRDLKECRPIEEVNCNLSTLAPTTEPPTTTEPSPEDQCLEARNNTFIRNPMSCREFFICVDGEAEARTCRDNLWFNFIQQRCTPSYQAICELKIEICDGVENENTIRSPSSCTDFITCINGRPYPGQCYGNLFFDEETQRCEAPENVQCELENLPTEPPPTDNPCWGVLDFFLAASPGNCSQYFICYNNEIIQTLECPENQFFDVNTQVCGDFECETN